MWRHKDFSGSSVHCIVWGGFGYGKPSWRLRMEAWPHLQLHCVGRLDLQSTGSDVIFDQYDVTKVADR